MQTTCNDKLSGRRTLLALWRTRFCLEFNASPNGRHLIAAALRGSDAGYSDFDEQGIKQVNGGALYFFEGGTHLTSIQLSSWNGIIPPIRRIGDFVHCASRVVNILMKRLLGEFENPRQAAPLKDLIHSVSQDAINLPMAQRLAPRKSKPGNLE